MEQTELEKLCRWEGNKEVREDIISLASVRALAATLNYKPDDYNEGKLLPPLYHWLSFLDLTRLDELADDGHAEKGGFMPPVPFPRRMFAGGRIQFSGDLQIGEKVSRISTIKSVKHKKGRTGEIIFVTVSHQISNKDGVQLKEEHDIAYLPGPQEMQLSQSEALELPEADFSRSVKPDERLLFRFSALTFNTHRIHYDLPYVHSEGYPALVVHGPLTAMLLADLVWRENDFSPLKQFSYRAKNPLYIGDTMHLIGKRVDEVIELTAYNDHGIECFSAKALLR